MTKTISPGDINIRTPEVSDGAAIWQLVADAGTLDKNSSYLYLVLCRDFPDYCAVAERDGRLLGFVTGYVSPLKPDVWFTWQVGVSSEARGAGLARRLIMHVLENITGENGQSYLETTVTVSNDASRALFRGIARRLNTDLTETALFTSEMFPEGGHEAEPLLRVGPFDAAAVAHAGD